MTQKDDFALTNNTASNGIYLKQVSTLPPVITKKYNNIELHIFRLKSDKAEFYQIDKNGEPIFQLSAWQYHVLNALFAHGGDKFETLLINVNDRFGLKLTEYDIFELFEDLKEKQLFDDVEAPRHPLTQSFCKINTDQPSAYTSYLQKTFEHENNKKPRSTITWYHTALFNPSGLFKILRTPLSSLKYILFPLPIAVIAAAFILFNNTQNIMFDLPKIFSDFSLITHLIIGFFTTNLLGVLTYACTAHAYGATINNIGLSWLLFIFPRFKAIIDDTEKLTRYERIWLALSPIMANATLFSVSVFLWYKGRAMPGVLDEFAATLSLMSLIWLTVNICPFNKRYGYEALAAFVDEPYLREKSVKAFWSKFKKNSHEADNNNLLAVFGVASLTFTVLFLGTILYIFQDWLNVQLGTTSYVILGCLFILLATKIWEACKDINESYERNQKFEQWRLRILPADVVKSEQKPKSKKSLWSYAKYALLIGVIYCLTLPYPYQPSGSVILMSEKQRQVATDIGGIIDQVYFEGGEFVAEGALIAKLSTEDYRSQVNVLKAELTAIDAKVTSTKARPKAENIEVSKQSLVVAQTQMQYSQDELERNEILFNSGTISQEKFAAYQRAASVDAKQYEKAKAEVQAASVGATKEQVSAVEAEKAPIIAEIQKLQNKIDRSVLKAPFAGRLTTLYLKEQEGRFLDRGQALSTIEDTRRFKVDLQIPETDLQYVKEGSIVNIKMNAYPDTLIKGKVKMLDSGVDGTKGVSIIKAIVYVENPPVELRSGMTGYARVESETLTLWEVLTKSLYRFVTVELWAWLP